MLGLAGRQRRRQVDADQDPERLPEQDAGDDVAQGRAHAPKSVLDAPAHGIDTVYQDLALIDQLTVYKNLFLRRELIKLADPVSVQPRDAQAGARGARRDHVITSRSVDVPVARAVGRSAPGDRGRAHDLRRRRRDPASTSRWPRWAPRRRADPRPDRSAQKRRRVSIIMILPQLCARLPGVRPRQPDPGRRHLTGQADARDAASTSSTDIVVEEYRRARLAAQSGRRRLGGRRAGRRNPA